jgi:hypothetical protein
MKYGYSGYSIQSPRSVTPVNAPVSRPRRPASRHEPDTQQLPFALFSTRSILLRYGPPVNDPASVVRTSNTHFSPDLLQTTSLMIPLSPAPSYPPPRSAILPITNSIPPHHQISPHPVGECPSSEASALPFVPYLPESLTAPSQRSRHQLCFF